MSTDVLGVLKRRRTWLIICALLFGSLIAWSNLRDHRLGPAKEPQASGAHCDDGIGAAKSLAAAASDPIASASEAAWSPKVNDSAPPSPAPAGMIWIPGGHFWMGTDEPHWQDAKPWHRVYVDGFWMDKTEVTNKQFTEFVKATGYVTVAELTPRAEDYPGARPENLIAGSVVFTPPKSQVALNNHFQWWSYVVAANWRHPEGPSSDIKSRMNHPVVHVAYDDAVAYCKWAGKRLPTEAEFEFASRGGLDRKRYDWGDELRPGGKTMANIFQGHFPSTNTGEDGYKATAPVVSFPANGFGLFDMSGNVWEWTSDWYRPDYYATLAARGEEAVNPKGPANSFDPSEPGVAKRVHRGGAYLCTDQYCSRHAAGGRGKGEP
ncbi:MAG TPA: formylglycine-generating enzyme family protein, partial [Bryobacteraceae bacterium]